MLACATRACVQPFRRTRTRARCSFCKSLKSRHRTRMHRMRWTRRRRRYAIRAARFAAACNAACGLDVRRQSALCASVSVRVQTHASCLQPTARACARVQEYVQAVRAMRLHEMNTLFVDFAHLSMYDAALALSIMEEFYQYVHNCHGPYVAATSSHLRIARCVLPTHRASRSAGLNLCCAVPLRSLCWLWSPSTCWWRAK
ncbi:hypothetical protein EON67_10240 [archaeon]|nr:MAG: hypothetical protein EON67_10240 [archaeon]